MMKPIHYFISYPKSGRTWMRFMLDSYIAKYFKISVKNVFEVETKVHYAYQIEYTHLSAAMNYHRPYFAVGAINSEKLKNKYAVVMTRNIYDTLASAYFQAVYRDFCYYGDVSGFVRSRKFGAQKIVAFYNMLWDIWELFERFDWFSYEQMKADLEGTFRWFLKLARLQPIEELIREVIQEGSFENMRKAAMAPEYAQTWLSPVDRRQEDSAKMREAGSARRLFNEADTDFIRTVIDTALRREDVPFFNSIRQEA